VGFADLDNDGRIDLVISHLNEPVSIFRNVAAVGNHWLGIDLVGKDRRDVVGSKVVVECGGRRLTRFATGGGSFASSGDRRLVLGLGTDTKVDWVEVHWSWSGTQVWSGLAVDRYWRLLERQPAAEAIPQREQAASVP